MSTDNEREIVPWVGQERRASVTQRLDALEASVSEINKDIKQVVAIFSHSKWAFRVIAALGIFAVGCVTFAYYVVSLWHEVLHPGVTPPTP